MLFDCSLWDVNYDRADERISARRQRIRNRLEAAKKVRTLIQVKHVFGYCDDVGVDQYAVEVRIIGFGFFLYHRLS